MTNFREKYGAWALITGASSGIGAEFARQLAAKKLDLILVARRKNRLVKLAKELRAQHGIEIKTVPLDLAKPGFLKTLLRQVATSNVGLLVNNAGFGIAGSFTDQPLEDELRMLDVNCRAALILAHEFANRMVQHRRGGIIMVSSVAAFQGVPFMSHYAATKAYDLILGEGLYHELKRFGVDVLTLCPGATATEFAQVAGGKDFPQAMAVAPVVAEALDALGKKSHVVTGAKNKLSVFATRLLPRRLTSYAAMQVMRRLGRSGRA